MSSVGVRLPTAWLPHTRCNTDKIEAVQSRAARSVLNDWSHRNTQTPALKELHPYTIGSSSSMLQFLGWNSLEERRGHYSLVMMYKIVHGLVVIPTTPYLLPASYDTRGHSSEFLVPSTRVNAFRYSYFPATIMSWNGLCTYTTCTHNNTAPAMIIRSVIRIRH